ncbi:MAG: hypothetical protein KC616_17725 [Myxococcales bacterium]|nr:hypothetical protein [Myxococcales bacterium]
MTDESDRLPSLEDGDDGSAADVLLSAWIDGELPEAEARALEARMAREPALARRAAALRRVDETLRGIEARPVPTDLRARLAARIEATRGVAEQNGAEPDAAGPADPAGEVVDLGARRRARGLRWASLVAAAGLAGLLGLWVMRSSDEEEATRIAASREVVPPNRREVAREESPDVVGEVVPSEPEIVASTAEEADTRLAPDAPVVADVPTVEPDASVVADAAAVEPDASVAGERSGSEPSAAIVAETLEPGTGEMDVAETLESVTGETDATDPERDGLSSEELALLLELETIEDLAVIEALDLLLALEAADLEDAG